MIYCIILQFYLFFFLPRKSISTKKIITFWVILLATSQCAYHLIVPM